MQMPTVSGYGWEGLERKVIHQFKIYVVSKFMFSSVIWVLQEDQNEPMYENG